MEEQFQIHFSLLLLLLIRMFTISNITEQPPLLHPQMSSAGVPIIQRLFGEPRFTVRTMTSQFAHRPIVAYVPYRGNHSIVTAAMRLLLSESFSYGNKSDNPKGMQ